MTQLMDARRRGLPPAEWLAPGPGGGIAGLAPGLLPFVEIAIERLIEQALLLIAGIAGAWLHRRWLWPYSVGVILACGAYLLVTAQGRYLVEIIPLIATLSATALFHEGTGKTAQPQLKRGAV